jgi:hypothetical protein
MCRWACDSTLNKQDKNFPKSIDQHWTLPNMTSQRKYTRLTTSYTNIEVFDLWQRLWRGIHPCVQSNCHCRQKPLLYRTPYLLRCCCLHPRRSTLFQWLPAYQSARKCSVEGIALKQTNPLCYQHEVSRCSSGKQEHIVSKKNRQYPNSRVPGRNVQNAQWVESQNCHINQAIKHIFCNMNYLHTD